LDDRAGELRARYQPDFERMVGSYEGRSPLRKRLDEFTVGEAPRNKAGYRALGREMVDGLGELRRDIQAEMGTHTARIAELREEQGEINRVQAKSGELEFLRRFSRGRDLSDGGRNLTPAELAGLHTFYRNFHTGKIR